MAAVALLWQMPDLSDEQLGQSITNLCRCGTMSVSAKRSILPPR
jgi:hypothetical protein